MVVTNHAGFSTQVLQPTSKNADQEPILNDSVNDYISIVTFRLFGSGLQVCEAATWRKLSKFGSAAHCLARRPLGNPLEVTC